MEPRTISALVNGLSPVRKELLRDTITETYKVSRFLGNTVHQAELGYVMALLEGRKPMPMRSIKRRNGKVVIVRKGGENESNDSHDW